MSIIFVDSFFPRLQALVFSSFVCGLWIGECCDLGSLTQRLVHVLALRLNSLSSWGVGNLGALFNQSCLWVQNCLKAAIVLARLVETAQ